MERVFLLRTSLVVRCPAAALRVFSIALYRLFLPGNKVVKNPLATAGEARYRGSIPGPCRSPGAGKGSCLDKSLDRGAGRPAVQAVSEAHDWGSEHGIAFKDQRLLRQTISTVSSHTFLSKTRLLFASFVLLWAFVKLCVCVGVGLGWLHEQSLHV